MTIRLGLVACGPDPLTASLLDAIAEAAESIDVETGWVRTFEDERAYDAVLAVGPPKSYRWLFASPQLADRISWFGEPLPRGSRADARFGHRPGIGRAGGASAAVLRTARRAAGPLTGVSPPGRLRVWREAAAIEHERQANLALVAWCQERGARIVVTSRDRGAALAAAGIPSSVVPFGYHARHAGPLTAPDTERDIAVAIVGSGLRSNFRRGRVMARLLPELRRLGQVVEIDGRWGTERDAILRRARVILDVQRVPGNFTGLRWLLAAAAGAVYVVEPMDDPAPLRADVDHLEAPAETLVASVARLLADEPRRRSIVEESQVMLRGDLAMHRCLEDVLAS